MTVQRRSQQPGRYCGPDPRPACAWGSELGAPRRRAQPGSQDRLSRLLWPSTAVLREAEGGLPHAAPLLAEDERPRGMWLEAGAPFLTASTYETGLCLEDREDRA